MRGLLYAINCPAWGMIHICMLRIFLAWQFLNRLVCLMDERNKKALWWLLQSHLLVNLVQANLLPEPQDVFHFLKVPIFASADLGGPCKSCTMMCQESGAQGPGLRTDEGPQRHPWSRIHGICV